MLGSLERAEDARAHVEGVLDRLQAWRVVGPGVLAEIRVARAGRDDERVVRERLAVGESDLAGHRVDVDGLTQEDARVRLVAKDVAERLGDLGRREGSGRDLVEQRREDVVVPTVEQDDVHVRAAESLGRIEAAEAPAHDEHAMPCQRPTS